MEEQLRAARQEWGAGGGDETVRGRDQAFPSSPSPATPNSATGPHFILLYLSVLFLARGRGRKKRKVESVQLEKNQGKAGGQA